MAIPNPIYGLVLPFLCIFTLPLALFAGITTTIAFSILMFRVVLVYIDIALGFVPQYLMGRSGPGRGHRHWHALPAPHDYRGHDGQWSPTELSPAGNDQPDPGSGHGALSQPSTLPLGYITTGHRSMISSPTSGRRSRRPSMGGSTVGNITPGREGRSDATIAFAFPSTASSSTNGIARDFEGVGGWRLGPDGDDETDWANINSRLELPLERMPRQGQSHHYRTPTGGSTGAPVTPGEGSWLMMKNPKRKPAQATGSPEREPAASRSGRASVSPNSSRVRMGQGTVTFTGVGEDGKIDGYFPSATGMPSFSRKPSY